jgi:ATP synthase protein I
MGGDLVEVSLADVRMAAADWTSVRSAGVDLAIADGSTADLSGARAEPDDALSAGAAPVQNEPADTMAEYYQLQQELLVTTLVLSGVLFPCVWFAYTPNIALNYLLGACTGVVYLKLLARNVERLGSGSASPGKSHLAVFGGVMIVATQWNSLHVLPVFLGFLTFKLTLLLYTLRILLKPGVNA